jgi:hypothetical protein
MAITLREGLGRKLTIAEMDENFTFLSSSYVVNSITASMTAGNADSASVAAIATTLSADATASFANLASDARTSDSSSVAARATLLSADATASIADLATTASHTAGTASIADFATTSSHALTIRDGLTTEFASLTLTGDLDVAGTASFGLLTSTTASSFIIGDARILLNADTPAVRFSGITVVDSGSDPYTTASFLYDGSTHDWKYEYETGGDHDAAVALFGPVMSDLTGSVYPVSESLVIGTGGHHLTSSTITVSNFTASMDGLFSGSFEGDGSQLTGLDGFPYTGSAEITGSLNVVGNLLVDGAPLSLDPFPYTGSAEISGSLTVVGTITETSARKYKENISTLDTQLNNILQLNPVEYNWVNGGKHDIGLIAEEVNEIYPDLVQKENEEITGIQYSRLTSVLIKAVQELAARVEELENK